MDIDEAANWITSRYVKAEHPPETITNDPYVWSAHAHGGLRLRRGRVRDRPYADWDGSKGRRNGPLDDCEGTPVDAVCRMLFEGLRLTGGNSLAPIVGQPLLDPVAMLAAGVGVAI